MDALDVSLGDDYIDLDVSASSLANGIVAESQSIIDEIVSGVCELGDLEQSLQDTSIGPRGLNTRWSNIQRMLRETIHNLKMVTRPDYASEVVSCWIIGAV